MSTSIHPDRIQYGLSGGQAANARPDLILDWHDVYGEPHRKIIKHDFVPLIRSEGKPVWAAMNSDPDKSTSGPIAAVRYQDKGSVPVVKPRFLAGKWIDRNGG